MSEMTFSSRRMSRITCTVHERFGRAVNNELLELGIQPVFSEAGRSVRQLVRPRPFRFPGSIVSLEGSPVEVYSLAVPEKEAGRIIAHIAHAADINTPGNGSVYVHKITEYFPAESSSALAMQNFHIDASPGPVVSVSLLLEHLSLIVFILSMPGSGDVLAREALELGAGVPVITLGQGTGLRDRLGLLRITIPPEKEITHLLVPEHDSESIIRLMIEELRLNLPGRGFIYSTPVSSALVDTRIRTGKQEHAASMEQIIAAIDELKSGTTWRKRFVRLKDSTAVEFFGKNNELIIYCPEGQSGEIIRTCIQSGAGGATVAKVKRLRADKDQNIAAHEKILVNVAAGSSARVVQNLFDTGVLGRDKSDRVHVTESPIVFTYHR